MISGPSRSQLLAKLGGLMVAAAGDVVVIEETTPILLRPKAATALAEEENPVSPARDPRVGHAPHLAGLGSVVQIITLSTGAGLLLHDHKVAAVSAHIIEIEGL